MKKTMLKLMFLTLMMIPPGASAHYIWINADNYNPEKGGEIVLSLAWGHRFPDSPAPKAEATAKILLIDPDGKETELPVRKDKKGLLLPVKVKLEKSGTYLAFAEKKSGFVCKTTRGYIHKPKKELKGVIKSFWSEGNAKAVINAGKPGGKSFEKALPPRYQIIPLDNPGKLKKDDFLRVKVLLDGKPFKTKVYATYAGFSEDKETFAYATVTDGDGTARIKILEPGVWIVKAGDKIPYPDKESADYYSFSTALTFEVK